MSKYPIDDPHDLLGTAEAQIERLKSKLTRAEALAEAAKAAKLQARLCMDTKIFTIGEAKYIFDVLDSALAAWEET